MGSEDQLEAGKEREIFARRDFPVEVLEAFQGEIETVNWQWDRGVVGCCVGEVAISPL